MTTEAADTEADIEVPRIFSKHQLAKRYGVSTVAIDGWMRRGCPYTRGARSLRFDLAEVAEWRAAELVNRSKRNGSGRKVCPEAGKIMGSLALAAGELIPWSDPSKLLTFPEYAKHAEIGEGELFTLLCYGLPMLPAAPGEALGRISPAHADRWRAMFAIYVEGLGGDGLSNRLGDEAHRLRGLPPAGPDEEEEGV